MRRIINCIITTTLISHIPTSNASVWKILTSDDTEMMETMRTLRNSQIFNPFNIFREPQNPYDKASRAEEVNQRQGGETAWFTGANEIDTFKDENGNKQFFIMSDKQATRDNLIANEGEDSNKDYCGTQYGGYLWCPKSEYEQDLVYANLFMDSWPYLEEKKMDFGTHEKAGFFTVWTGIERKPNNTWFSINPNDYECRNGASQTGRTGFQNWGSSHSFNESAFQKETVKDDKAKCINVGERWSMKWNMAPCDSTCRIEGIDNVSDCPSSNGGDTDTLWQVLGRPICVSTDQTKLSDAKTFDAEKIGILRAKFKVFIEEFIAIIFRFVFVVVLLWISGLSCCCCGCFCGCCCGCCSPCRMKMNGKDGFGNEFEDGFGNEIMI